MTDFSVEKFCLILLIIMDVCFLQVKLHETITKLEEERNSWLTKVVCLAMPFWFDINRICYFIF